MASMRASMALMFVLLSLLQAYSVRSRSNIRIINVARSGQTTLPSSPMGIEGTSRGGYPRVGYQRASSAAGAEATLVCTQVHGAKSGETCFSMSTALNVTMDVFTFINPNLNCDKIFVGQWICVNGKII